jgi:hypothetical protein
MMMRMVDECSECSSDEQGRSQGGSDDVTRFLLAMSRLLGSLRPHFRAAFSLGGLFIPVANASTISQLTRDPRKTKYILRTPPTNPAPPREVPTPLVFVSAEGWDKDSSRGYVLMSLIT